MPSKRQIAGLCGVALNGCGFAGLIYLCELNPRDASALVLSHSLWCGTGCGVLISAGLLLMIWRYSLALMLALVVLAAGVGFGVNQLLIRTTVSRTFAAPPPVRDEFVALINSGLIRAMVERGEWPRNDAPVSVEVTANGLLLLRIKPFADPRVRLVLSAADDYLTSRCLWIQLGNPTLAENAVLTWHQRLSSAFGDAAADAIMNDSAEVVSDPDLKDLFRHVHDPKYQNWSPLKL